MLLCTESTSVPGSAITSLSTLYFSLSPMGKRDREYNAAEQGGGGAHRGEIVSSIITPRGSCGGEGGVSAWAKGEESKRHVDDPICVY